MNEDTAKTAEKGEKEKAEKEKKVEAKKEETKKEETAAAAGKEKPAEKKAEKKTTKKSAAKSGTGKVEKLVDEIGSLTVIELSELVDTLKDKFSIEAVAVAPAVGAAAGAAPGAEAADEKSEFDVILTDVGGQKLQVLKEVRSITGLGLKEAKDVIDNLPGTVKEAAAKEEAEEIKKKLESVGAKVELK